MQALADEKLLELVFAGAGRGEAEYAGVRQAAEGPPTGTGRCGIQA